MATYDHTSELHQRTLRYCTTCPKMCRFACPVAHVEARETVTPWGLNSLLHAAEGGHVALDDEAARVLMRCTGCLRCQTACRHDNHLPRAVFEGRRQAREGGAALGWTPSSDGHASDLTPLDGPALGFAPASDELFWPSCHHRRGDPSGLRRLAALLDAFGLDVALFEQGGARCCGYPLLASGQTDVYRRHARVLGARLSGARRVITDCDALLMSLRTPGWQEHWRDGSGALEPAKVIHWTEALAERLGADIGALPEVRRPPAGALTYHDGCRLGRGAQVYEAPRALLRWVAGEAGLVELEDHGAAALCCGQGAGYPEVAPEHARTLARGPLLDALRVGARVLISAAPGCVAHLRTGASSEAAEPLALDAVLCDALALDPR